MTFKPNRLVFEHSPSELHRPPEGSLNKAPEAEPPKPEAKLSDLSKDIETELAPKKELLEMEAKKEGTLFKAFLKSQDQETSYETLKTSDKFAVNFQKKCPSGIRNRRRRYFARQS